MVILSVDYGDVKMCIRDRNSSRGIMCAYKKGGFDEKDYAVAARKEAIRMRDEINSVYKG